MIDVEVNERVAIEYMKSYYTATVVRVTHNFIYASVIGKNGFERVIKFNREGGRESGVVIYPCYLSKMDEKIDSIMRKREALAEIACVKWDDVDVDILENIVDLVKQHGR